ncbi:MAG: DUF1194 domain-containing protein [Rhodospirillales bacterium]|nr:DUF1194 domain-containing protein [Rhodospirillales bacterium]
MRARLALPAIPAAVLAALLVALVVAVLVVPGAAFLAATAPAALAASPAASPAAGQPVDVALVLVTDVSHSITGSEFALEKQGYASAFQNPAVVNAIRHGAIGAIAVTYVEFAGSERITTVVGWHLIRDGASAHRFAEALLAAPRSATGRTAIGSGIAAAALDLAESGFAPTRRVIDVCGDGNSNAGISLATARTAALKAGITINGLAIIHAHPPAWLAPHVDPPGGIVHYYRDNVIGGPGSFVMQVNNHQDFSAAMTRKLILELAAR